MTDGSSNFGAAFPAEGVAAGAQYLDEAPTYAPGELVPLQTDVHGNLKVVASGALTLQQGVESWRVAWDGQSVAATMDGPWNVGRSWSLAQDTDSVSAAQSGRWVVRADAGEGLNTSALALESGGNLAAVAAALGAVDDGIYSGSGAASVIGGLKGVCKLLSGTLSVSWANQGVTLAGELPGFAKPPLVEAAALPMTATSLPASSHVLKRGPGKLLSLNVAAEEAAGWVVVLDATSEPADGAIKTPLYVRRVAKEGDLDKIFANPLAFEAGCVVVFSSAGPFAKKTGARAFIAGQCQ